MESPVRSASLLVHVALFATALVLVFVGSSFLILATEAPASRWTMTLHETARLLRGQPIANGDLHRLTITRVARAPLQSNDAASQLFVKGLAGHLGTSADSVRLNVVRQPRVPLVDLRREYDLYSPDGAFDPEIMGAFEAAWRNDDGSWTVLKREPGKAKLSHQERNLQWISGWLVVGLLLAWWFSRRIAIPIRKFSDATERVGRGDHVPIPISGPTEIRRAARSVNDMQARIQRYVRERTSVVGAVAHDLRTPLTRLRFGLASVPEHFRVDAEAAIKEMEALIQVTLDFVEHDSWTHRKELLDISILVEGIVDDFADIGADATMVHRELIILQGDQLLLKRLFANLIDNALKYAGAAKVAVRKDGIFAVVDIEDTGPGMSEATIARAFEPFYRGESSRNRQTGGAGLGLAIVKFAVDAHYGEVELSNLAGVGLRARVRLPLAIN